MIELLKKLCLLDGTSGDEGAVRDFIIDKIDGFCDWHIDNLGSIIAFKKGRKTPKKKIMIDAHTDEVGLIITRITSDGFLKFATVGGIDTAALMNRKVLINGKLCGVIGGKPIHLLKDDEGKKLPEVNSLAIDIGASNLEEAAKYVSLGDRAVICSDFIIAGNNICSKALDDRIGCAILITLLQNESEYDFYASFSVQEEVGLRGATASAFAIAPDVAIVLEGTTAADIADVPQDKKVCSLGDGPAISFMDRSTLYDRELYNAALTSGIKCQSKSAVAGGNNAGAIHTSRAGVRTIAISVPCRYIHSANSVANIEDIQNAAMLTKYMLRFAAEGIEA